MTAAIGRIRRSSALRLGVACGASMLGLVSASAQWTPLARGSDNIQVVSHLPLGPRISVADIELEQIRTLQVLIGDRVNTVEIHNVNVDVIFDAQEPAQHDASLFGFGKFDHESRFQVRSVGNQRIVYLQFFVDAISFKYSLNAQHFLHLVLHCQSVFEIQSSVRAEVESSSSTVSDSSIALNNVGNALQRLKHRRQPWQTSKTRSSSSNNGPSL